MSDPYAFKIDLDRLTARLSASLGRLFAARGTDRWLAENGFQRAGDHWVAEASHVSLLEQAEVIAVWPVDEPDGASQVEYPAAEPTTDDAWPKPPPPYVLTEERRQQLSLMPDYEQCMIPTFLCGSPAGVISKWRSCAKKIVRSGRFDVAMKRVEFVHIDRAAGRIITRRPSGFSGGDAQIVIYATMGVLSEIVAEMAKDVHEIFVVRQQLLTSGLDHFWFCLCFVVGGMSRLELPARYDADLIELRRVVVQKVLKWWPHLCARADRFERDEFVTSRLPFWTGVSGLFESQEVWQQLNKMDCDGVEEYLRQWLKEN